MRPPDAPPPRRGAGAGGEVTGQDDQTQRTRPVRREWAHDPARCFTCSPPEQKRHDHDTARQSLVARRLIDRAQALARGQR
jgi:hypothetical protein